MKKRRFSIAILVAVIILLSFIAISLFVYHTGFPRGVWVSDSPHIVIFNHRRYDSPFHEYGRQDSRHGYMTIENGEKIYFFVNFFDGIMRFYDSQTFFDFDEDMRHEPIMRGYWRRTRRQFTLVVDDTEITFTRITDYEPPNTFAWNPGLENLHGTWETKDGRLWLDLEEASLMRSDSSALSALRTSPRFRGVYDPDSTNVGLMVSGIFTPHTGTFLIVISENGNLRGHSFAPIGGGRFMRADGTLDGDAIHLRFTHSRFATMSGEWLFPDEFILYRVSD